MGEGSGGGRDRAGCAATAQGARRRRKGANAQGGCREGARGRSSERGREEAQGARRRRMSSLLDDTYES